MAEQPDPETGQSSSSSEPAPRHDTTRRARHWLSWFLDGVEDSFELSFTWYFIYVAILIAHTFIHMSTTEQASPPWQPFLFYVAAIGFGLVIFLFYIRFSEREPSRRGERRVAMLSFAVLTLLCLSVPYLFDDTAHGGTDYLWLIMRTGTQVWVAAFIFLFCIAIVPGAAFNKDFADLQSFPFIKMLRLVAGAILFLVAARQLLVWQDISVDLEKSVGVFLSGLLVYDVAPLNLLSRVWSWLEPGILMALVALALILSYIHLSIKTTRGRFPGVIWGAIPLIFQQILARARVRKYKDKLLWPTSHEGVRGPRDVHQDAQLIEYSLTTTYPAVTLLFALSLPTILDENLDLIWPRLLFLGVFIVGNVDIWLQTLDLISARGISYTLGAWASTLLLYWPTTLLAILIIGDIWRSSADSTDNILAFGTAYRFIVPALTILLAFNQLDDARAIGPARIFRRGIATISLFLLLGFGLKLLLDLRPDLSGSYWRVAGYLGLVLVYFLLQRPRIEARLALHRPQVAQLLTASSIAVSPVLINKFVRDVQLRPDGMVNLTATSSCFPDQELQLRMHVVGSEEEVAWEATSPGRSWLRGKIDFIITDLLTAIDIIGEGQRRTFFKKEEYRIAAILGDFRWTQVRIGPDDNDRSLVLDAGFLLYSPNIYTAAGTSAPCDDGGDDCRQSSFAIISHYANKCRDQVGLVHLPEPYNTWLRRKLEESEAERMRPPRLRPEIRRVYVVLMRENRNQRRFDWRRTMVEMILDGQRAARMDQDRLNDDHLNRLHDFFQHVTHGKLDFSFSDIHLALCECQFEPRLSVNEGSVLINNFGYPAARTKLRVHNLLTRNTLGGIIRRVSVEEAGLPPDSPIEPAQEAYGIEKFEKYLSEPLITNVSWLRAMLDESRLPHLEHQPPLLNLSLFEGLAAAQTAAEREFKTYFVPISRIPISNYPGQIANILQKINTENVNYKFLSSTNMGHSAFIYLFSDSVLSDQLIENIRAGQVPFDQPIRPDGEIEDTLERMIFEIDERRLSNEGIDLQQLMAFAVPIRNEPGSLLALLNRLKVSSPSTAPINLEQTFVFPLSTDIALALLVPSEVERERLFARLMNRPEPVYQAGQLPSPRKADEVSLDTGFPFRRRHQQRVIFKTQGLIPEGAIPRFRPTRSDMRTYSPLGKVIWGSSTRCRPEIDFDEIRLIIPTELVWWVNLSDRLRRLGQPFRSGPAPSLYERYSQPDSWELYYERVVTD